MTPVDVLEAELERRADEGHDDVRDFARRVCDEACSIQKLLHEHAETTRLLGTEVRGFVERDNAEEDALQKIALSVANAEMGALRDVRYVEFLQRRMHAVSGSNVGVATAFPISGDGGSCGHRVGCVALPPDGAPNAFLNLGDYGDVVDVLLGWRSTTRATQAQLDLLLECILRRVPDLSSCVLFVNGFLYTPCDTCEAWRPTEGELEAIMGDGRGAVAEEVLARWLDAVVMRSLLTGSRLRHALSTAGALERSGLWLFGDGHDTLCVVDHARVLHSAVFRGFFFSGELRAVESIGSQANLMLSLFGVSGSEGQQRMERRVVDVFRGLEKQGDGPISGCKNAVVLLSLQGDVSAASADDLPTLKFVVLDIRSLTPSLPFAWHFTWAEICALGQLDTTAGAGDCSLSLPVFKTTRVAVASLQPYDALSREAFPVFNKHLRGVRSRRQLAMGLRGFSAVSTAAVAASVIVVLVGVGLFRGRPVVGYLRV